MGTGCVDPAALCLAFGAIGVSWGGSFSLCFPQGLGSRSALDFIPQRSKRKLPSSDSSGWRSRCWQWQQHGQSPGRKCRGLQVTPLTTCSILFQDRHSWLCICTIRGLRRSRALVPELLGQKTRRGSRNLYSDFCVSDLAKNHFQTWALEGPILFLPERSTIPTQHSCLLSNLLSRLGAHKMIPVAQWAHNPTYFVNKVLLDPATVFVDVLALVAFLLLWHSWIICDRDHRPTKPKIII